MLGSSAPTLSPNKMELRHIPPIAPDQSLYRLLACARGGRGREEGGAYSTPIVVRSWNQCCACTKLLILGDRAWGLVSCTTHTSTASSTTRLCARAISSSCFFGSKVRLASSMTASTFGFEYQPQLTPTGAT